MPGRLQDKRVVVAGLGPGMGSAIAARAAEEGARVLGAARTARRVEETAATLGRAGIRIDTAAIDLTDGAAVRELVRVATERLGGAPDVLVNSAGGWRGAPAEVHDPDLVEAMLDTNLRTVMTTTPIFAAAMKEAGVGAIVNVGGAFGAAFPSQGQAVYNATKAAVRAYTESVAADLLEFGIRVNCVLPGGTTHDFRPGRDAREGRRLGKDRTGWPEDVAAAVVFLASDDAGWITGASLLVDGGESLRRT